MVWYFRNDDGQWCRNNGSSWVVPGHNLTSFVIFVLTLHNWFFIISPTFFHLSSPPLPCLQCLYLPKAFLTPALIFSILASVSTYPSPFFLEWRSSPPTTWTSSQPVVPGVPSPVISNSLGNSFSSSALILRNLGAYPHAPQYTTWILSVILTDPCLKFFYLV